MVVIKTKRYKRDIKKYNGKVRVIEELENVLINFLVSGKPLPAKYRDHALQGKYSGIRELHVKPDVLLLYAKSDGNLILYALGSHAKLF